MKVTLCIFMLLSTTEARCLPAQFVPVKPVRHRQISLSTMQMPPLKH